MGQDFFGGDEIHEILPSYIPGLFHKHHKHAYAMKSGSWNLNFFQDDDFMVHVMSLKQGVLITAHILSKAWGGLKHYCTWSPLDMRRIPWLKQPLRQEIRHRDGVSVGMCL